MQVRVVQCQNGHYYDGNQYRVCPHCTDQPASVAVQCPNGHWYDSALFFACPHCKTAEPTPSVSAAPAVVDDDEMTVGHYGGETAVAEEPVAVEAVQPVVIEAVAAEEPAADGGSLQDAIRGATGDNDGVTLGFFSKQVPRTAPVGSLVCGWLVCVKGEHFGESFSIYAGRNAVGRLPGNHIVIAGEKTVSREKHAWITFDPQSRKFTVSPGESSGMTYLNGDAVMDHKPLCDGDTLGLGNAQFRVVVLCDESFAWEQYISEE